VIHSTLCRTDRRRRCPPKHGVRAHVADERVSCTPMPCTCTPYHTFTWTTQSQIPDTLNLALHFGSK
jgi:hypothetical protein